MAKWAFLIAIFAFGCSHSANFTWSPSFSTPDLTTLPPEQWDVHVGDIVQVRGPVEHCKRGPRVGGLYIDGIDKWPEGNSPIVVTGNLVRHDERVQAENGAQCIGAVYYSLSNVKWSRDN